MFESLNKNERAPDSEFDQIVGRAQAIMEEVKTVTIGLCVCLL